MHWLQRLHLIEVPEHTTLHSAQLSVRGPFPWWVAALVLAACAAGAFFLYRRESSRLSVARCVLLAALRTALVALVLGLLMRPVLLAEFSGERPRGVVLLVDNTESMRQQDRRVSDADRLRVAIARGLIAPDTPVTDTAALASVAPEQLKDPSRIEMIQDVLKNQRLRLPEALRGRGPLQTLLFADRLHSPPDNLPQSLTADGRTTALADSLHELLVRSGVDPPAAVVVVTDGRDKSRRLTLPEAAREYRDRGVPLLVWGVGSSAGGVLQLKDLLLPSTFFVDPRPEVRDDPVEVVVRWRCRGFKGGTVLLTLAVGEQVVRKEYPVREGEDVRQAVSFVPAKGKEGKRDCRISLELRGEPGTRTELRREVGVKNNRVKVLYVENLPRREYKFIQPVLERDRRVLARFFLVEGDARVAEAPADPETGTMFLSKFPPNFPDPEPRDPDRKPYDLLILGDVPREVLGEQGVRAVRRFVKEGGGLVVIAGREHAPADYARTPLEEVLPVEFAPREFPIDPFARTRPFRPALTYDGEQSALMSLADTEDENLHLWKDELWRNGRGFYWHYPVTGLRPGATALLVHPQLKTGGKTPRPMPLIARQFYGKGKVLFLGVDETWRWRYNAGDRLTARFWGQVVSRLGLPHLLGNSRRSQLRLERREAVLNRPGAVTARLLDPAYEPLTRPAVPATLVYLDDKERRERPVELRQVRGQPGEYRAALPNDAEGTFELRVDGGDGVDAASLRYRVELPPHHEREIAGMAERELRSLAAVSGGKFYREEDLHHLAADVEPRSAAFVQRQEVLLWNPLALVLFVGLVTAEWVLRKFSNLS